MEKQTKALESAMDMNDETANDEANADASRTSNSRESDIDGDDGEEFTNVLSQSRWPNQDDAVTLALGDGTPNPPASSLPLPTREMETANEDDPLMSTYRIAAAFEEMEEGSAITFPTAAAAPLSSTGPSPTPVRPASASAREGLETLEDEEVEGPAPAARSSLPRAGVEILNEGMPPMPAVQTAAAYKCMEQKIKSSISDAPPPPIPPMLADLTGAILFEDEGEGQTTYEKMMTIKEDDSQQEQDPPTPAIARALSLTPMDFDNMDAASLQRICERVRHQQEEILQQAQGLPTPAEEDAQHPSANPPVRTGSLPAIATLPGAGGIPLDRTQSVAVLPMRSPPRSMLPTPENDDDMTDTPSDPTLRVEGTLYEQDSVVYLATPVENDLRPWWKKQRTPIAIAVSGLVAGLAVALWAILGFGREPVLASSQLSEIQSSLPSLEPSQSSPPSKSPSLHPTFRPSQSFFPSPVRSAPPSTSLVPTTTPSSSSSTPPSASPLPTAFCFGGAINVFTDSLPEETSWTLSRITTEGVTNGRVIMQGSPEDESSAHAYEVCLERGEYEFTIRDTFGDGICCDAGAGHFELMLDGWVVLEGGEFEFSQTVSFSLPTASLPSSQSSVPSHSLSPTFRPSTSFSPSSQVPSLGPTSSLRPSSLPSLLPTAPPSTYWSSLVWEQAGQTITGEAPRDYSGRTVVLSEDGMTMAIGSPGQPDNYDRPGFVKVYHREDNASSWQELGQKIEGRANGNRFGKSLALSEDGRTLAIGAPGHITNLSMKGYGVVYQLEGNAPGSSWKQLGQDITHEAVGDRFGLSIALSANGRTLAIGDNVKHDYAGLVRIYGWDDDEPSWKQLGQNIKGEAPDDDSGYPVDLSSDGMTVAIGASGNDGNGKDSSCVRVYRRKGDGPSWEQLGQDIDGEAPGDESGFSLSLSADGRTLTIGAIYNGGNGVHSGHARVYRIGDAGLSWEQLGQDIDGEAAGDESGAFVSLSADGKTVAIGANANDGNGYYSGHVKVYRILEDSMNWKQVGRDIDGESRGDNSGVAVSLSADGKTVAIGSPRVGDDWGHVRVFNVSY